MYNYLLLIFRSLPLSFRHLYLIFSSSILLCFCSREYKVQQYSAIFSRFSAVFQRSCICNSSILNNIQLYFNSHLTIPQLLKFVLGYSSGKNLNRFKPFIAILNRFKPFETFWSRSVKSYLSIVRNCKSGREKLNPFRTI
jgi:hypothetical protein